MRREDRPFYGGRHRRTRARWVNELKANGQLPCVRCGEPIYANPLIADPPADHVAGCQDPDCPGECWYAMELDHCDDDPTRYNGPTHAKCNRQAGGRKLNGQRSQGRRRRTNEPTEPRMVRVW